MEKAREIGLFCCPDGEIFVVKTVDIFRPILTTYGIRTLKLENLREILV